MVKKTCFLWNVAFQVGCIARKYTRSPQKSRHSYCDKTNRGSGDGDIDHRVLEDEFKKFDVIRQPETNVAYYMATFVIIPLTAKFFNCNFHTLEAVSRWRDSQLKVSANYSDLTEWRSTIFKYCWLMSRFIINAFERRYLKCVNKKRISSPVVKGLKERMF